MRVQINPLGSMDLLSQIEVNLLNKTAKSDLYRLFRNCSLAVLNAGIKTDNSAELLSRYKDFDIHVLPTERGIKLELINPPEEAFVDGRLIRSIHKSLFAVLRDIIFLNGQINIKLNEQERNDPAFITNLVFAILRNAQTLRVGDLPNMIVCWGGHSINQTEYNYARQVGLELGLRDLSICTGCGAGVMEAPMKGAAIGYRLQQNEINGRFIGITEPGIIASEPPNPLVKELIIMPDIEKRLEAFVRLGHGIIIFPGGVGTAEEFLYILSILMNQQNKDQVLPLILTGPKESKNYFEVLDDFVVSVLGDTVKAYYHIIIDDAPRVAHEMAKSITHVRRARLKHGDSYHFNWRLKIDPRLQFPFFPTHENMQKLNLHQNQSPEELAIALRQVFSGIVAGNVKEKGIDAVKKHGPFQIHGDKLILEKLDTLLKQFIQQGRMSLLSGKEYIPCYDVIVD